MLNNPATLSEWLTPHSIEWYQQLSEYLHSPIDVLKLRCFGQTALLFNVNCL